MTAEPNDEADPCLHVFDYSEVIEARIAESGAPLTRIRERGALTIEEVVEAGKLLLQARKDLPPGCFGTWLKAERGWSAREADGCMRVAAWLGTMVGMAPGLRIRPSVAYLLTDRSTPEAAREEVLRLAKEGQEVSIPLAKKIMAEARKKSREKRKGQQLQRVVAQLAQALARWERCPEESLPNLAKQLREAAALERGGPEK